MAKLDRRGAGSQGISWRKDPTLEAGIALIEPDAHMNCAAFEHPCLFSAEGFAQLVVLRTPAEVDTFRLTRTPAAAVIHRRG